MLIGKRKPERDIAERLMKIIAENIGVEMFLQRIDDMKPAYKKKLLEYVSKLGVDLPAVSKSPKEVLSLKKR